MSRIYLPKNASKARLREAEEARRNRAEIVRELSWGRVSRRDLIKMGLFTTAGALAHLGGLNPFAKSIYGQMPKGMPPSPTFGCQPFAQPMPRFDVLARNPVTGTADNLVSCLGPAPTAEANQTMKPVDPALGGGFGPIEGRPPGPIWAHQRFNQFLPQIAVEAWQSPATTNRTYNPQVSSSLNSGIDPTHGIPLRFHPGMPIQNPNNVWTVNGTIPPKLVMGKYGQPLIFRHHNNLPVDVRQNAGFGRHTISTHEHNGHHGAENDGFTGAFFFPGQFYDYHWPVVLAGHFSANKAFGQDGQLFFDIFDFDGFIGDVNTVNLAYNPYFEVERRKYRFRILNASVSRFYKVALANASGTPQPITQIANDGNLLPHPVVLFELDEQGIAERYDIVIDFSTYAIGEKLHLVNLCDHFDPASAKLDGKKPFQDLTMAQALGGATPDPCVGRMLEFRVVRNPARPDVSRVADTLSPNPDLSAIPVARERVFEFKRDAAQTTSDPITSFMGPWGISTDGGTTLAADFGRVSAAPRFGTREIWTLKGGGGWDHPIHIHFEEGQVLARNGSAANVPAWERGRKDVYRLRPAGTITITMQFRDWGGMFMEHCHNTVHEDNAMLLRWEIDDSGAPFLRPLPTPIPTPQGVTFEPPTDVLPTAL